MINDSITKESLGSTEQAVVIKLKANQSISVTTKKYNTKSAFNMVSRCRNVLTTNKVSGERTWEVQGINFVQELCAMSKAEQRVISMIEDGIKWDDKLKLYDYVVSINQFDFDDRSQYNAFSRGYNLLFKKDLVRRVAKGKYMINPSVLIPSKAAEYFHKIWNDANSSTKVEATDVDFQYNATNPMVLEP